MLRVLKNMDKVVDLHRFKHMINIKEELER